MIFPTKIIVIEAAIKFETKQPRKFPPSQNQLPPILSHHAAITTQEYHHFDVLNGVKATKQKKILQKEREKRETKKQWQWQTNCLYGSLILTAKDSLFCLF